MDLLAGQGTLKSPWIPSVHFDSDKLQLKCFVATCSEGLLPWTARAQGRWVPLLTFSLGFTLSPQSPKASIPFLIIPSFSVSLATSTQNEHPSCSGPQYPRSPQLPCVPLIKWLFIRVSEHEKCLPNVTQASFLGKPGTNLLCLFPPPEAWKPPGKETLSQN